MKNIYLIYGLEDYLINEYKKEIINSIKVNNIINYDLSIDDLSDVLYEITSVSLFNKEKVIICENCTFLTSNSKKEDENKVKELIKYLNNPFDDVYILFIINSEKLDVRKKIVKELKTKSKVYEAKKIENYDLNNFLSKYISDRDYKISNKNISLLISIAGYNLQILINEINKLFLYKGDNKTIEEDDIRNLVTTNIENNIFSLTNSFLDNNKEKTINIYNDLLKAGIKHEAIIGTISNQLRLLLQVSLMKKNGYSDKEMVNMLKEHPYRIKLAKENSYSIKKLRQKIIDLCYLDLNIKTSKIDKTLGLELFLLNT